MSMDILHGREYHPSRLTWLDYDTEGEFARGVRRAIAAGILKEGTGVPLGKGVRYRFSGSGKGRVRLAFSRGGKVIERTPWPKGGRKGTSKRATSTRKGR